MSAPVPETSPSPSSAGRGTATALLDRHGLLDRVRDAGATAIEGREIVAPGGAVASGRFPDRPGSEKSR